MLGIEKIAVKRIKIVRVYTFKISSCKGAEIEMSKYITINNHNHGKLTNKWTDVRNDREINRQISLLERPNTTHSLFCPFLLHQNEPVIKRKNL